MQALNEKLEDMDAGAVVKFDPDEAEILGAFPDTALPLEVALEATNEEIAS